VTALWLLLLVPVASWLGQTVMLKRHGLPIRWRLDTHDAPHSVRAASRLFLQISLAGVIILYPLLGGQSVVGYYGSLLPVSGCVLQLAMGVASVVLFLCLLYGVWMATGRLIVEVHQPRKRWMRRLMLLGPTALVGAFAEELLFRGVLLADLLRSWPALPAVVVASLVFAVAHYVRSVKRYWTLPGHAMLGMLLCLAFLNTQSLWLGIGLHAGGNAMILGTRPFFVNRGPAWITGASVFPYAGVVGIIGLGILVVFVVMHHGSF